MEKGKRGFTLIELMLVVAIIGLLAAIALPKFADMVRKSKEARLRGDLGAFRSALSIYYADNEGFYPVVSTVPIGYPVLSVLTVGGKYIQKIPRPEVANYHERNNYLLQYLEVNSLGFDCDLLPASLFAYQGISGEPRFGHVFVLCNHTDTRGVTWSQE